MGRAGPAALLSYRKARTSSQQSRK